jgi:hypothetical protein
MSPAREPLRKSSPDTVDPATARRSRPLVWRSELKGHSRALAHASTKTRIEAGCYAPDPPCPERASRCPPCSPTYDPPLPREGYPTRWAAAAAAVS